MKTLDEVIKALTICKNPDINRNCKDCPMPDTHECMGVLMTDALHYLKAYKDDRNDLTALRAYWVEQQENPALSWDELIQMEGKPVWIEGPFITEGPHWIIVGPSYLLNGKIIGYGKTWQAYRKEITDAR